MRFVNSVEEPKLEAELSKKQDKFAFNWKNTHDWKNHGWETEAGVSYEGFDKLAIGAKVSFDKPSHDKNFGLKDYNLKLEYQRNPNQTFVLGTEKKFSEISLGGFAAVRDGTIGFGKLKINQIDREHPNWHVGVEQSVGDASTVTATLQDGTSSSVLFKGKLDKFEGHLVYHCRWNKSPAERHSLEYKLIFNC
ncbi:hypothetical protein RFI_00732 [Reticulomyxa filosa]|uniref:Uncharacterized protein n=1 Tax=Reticulomyxa filosa TaxID=46433 RepID=X6PCT6_RETFI|nr:hypothetical protein RFI_00732 [Reticulomyxa filosa]|eukprot:ETO36330.1 hypothetical protein RFI_00732 [Reticulomyxa filosa]